MNLKRLSFPSLIIEWPKQKQPTDQGFARAKQFFLSSHFGHLASRAKRKKLLGSLGVPLTTSRLSLAGVSGWPTLPLLLTIPD
jgi:hypothetical protein